MTPNPYESPAAVEERAIDTIGVVDVLCLMALPFAIAFIGPFALCYGLYGKPTSKVQGDGIFTLLGGLWHGLLFAIAFIVYAIAQHGAGLPHVAQSYFSTPGEMRLANSPSRHTHRPVAAAVSFPSPDVLRERVDLVEANNFYDQDNRLVFTQLLFWDFDFASGRHQLIAWRMVKPNTADKQSIGQPIMLPRYSHAHGEWICEWLDGDVQRRVSATNARETWTQFDPELEDREWLPKEKRRELRRAVTK